ncbi:MAG: YHYH protein [Acidimicrobiales bacterium]
MKTTRSRLTAAMAPPLVALALLAAACGADDSEIVDAVPDDPTTTIATAETAASETSGDATSDTASNTASDNGSTGSTVATAGLSCAETAALFVTGGSANANLADPEVSASCDGDSVGVESVVIASNGIPDYTYIETSPGSPRAADYVFTIPASPTLADELTDVPALGTAAVSLGGIPIYGPTEGTGGDVLSLAGALSECGSHNGPTGFHIHQILTTDSTDCLFTPAEVAAAPQLVGYALDGYPIYTGIDQYTSSWQLTDESLFASDTWAAHSYVEGFGDLDQCNGLTDADGNYAYYTTETFPYVIGCYAGVVDVSAAGGGGGGGR